MKANEIVKVLYKYFPKKHQLDWDYTGYNTGSPRTNVTKVVFAFDITNNLIDFAIKNNANMIISHHPLIWGEKKEVLETNHIVKKLYDKLKENKIVTFSAHTAIDGAKNGLNKWYLEILGSHKFKWLNKDLVQIGYFNNPVAFKTIVKKCKKSFKTNGVLTNFDKKRVKSILMASGSHGTEAIDLAKKHKVDLLIAGEMRHSSWIYANEVDVKLLLVGHYMEAIFSNKMKKIFQDKLNIEILSYKQKNIIEVL